MKKLQTLNNRNIIKIIILLIADAFLIQLASLLGISIRFDFHWGQIPEYFLDAITNYAIINTVCTIVLFWCFRLYHSVWHYATSSEMMYILGASGFSAAIQAVGMFLLKLSIPRSFHIFYFAFLTFFIFCTRFFYRILQVLQSQQRRIGRKNVEKCHDCRSRRGDIHSFKRISEQPILESEYRMFGR